MNHLQRSEAARDSSPEVHHEFVLKMQKQKNVCLRVLYLKAS